MKHASLFSGIGGFDLAAQWMGWENVFQVEWDKKCQQRLKKNFSQTEIYGNIDEFNGHRYTGIIDVLSGGPPCQPASNAGKRKGEKDDRWKWPQAIRVLGEIRPRYAVFENPDDLLSLDDGRAFERICVQMEDLGYKVETYGIPAACVGAWHERDRIWIIAYNDNFHDARGLEHRRDSSEARRGEEINKRKREAQDGQRIWSEPSTSSQIISNPYTQGLQESACGKFGSILETNGAFHRSELSGADATLGSYWKAEPGVVRMVHGIPNRVDRIKGLGNTIVPQVAFEIFKAIHSLTSEEVIIKE